jgi:DNA-binding transcriptional ArsR family regulator
LTKDNRRFGVSYTRANRRKPERQILVAGKSRFTRIPKTTALIHAGVPAEAIGTYCCLADYANNKTGLCFPKMETLAQTLNRSVRTIQRHLHLLRELGLIEFVERRRNQGRFSSYLYRVLHIVATTGHGKRLASKVPIYRRTKRSVTPPYSPPKKDLVDGYWWFFGEEAPEGAQEAYDEAIRKRREEEANRRIEGFEWFFDEIN